MIVHRQLESAPIEVADVRYERAVIALLAFGSALGIVALAYFAGFIVGRFL